MIKKIYILFLLLVNTLFGQVYPVQVTPQLIPPYSLTISEYTNASRDQLVLNLLLTDISELNRSVTLKFTLTNTAGFRVENGPVVVGALPITLNGGIPLRLTNADLQPYFEFQNLVGISPDAYGRTLPDGLYQFCFQVFDALSGQEISRQGCASAFLVLNDPPFLNTPSKGEIIAEKNPQNIIFQWTPRHLNATNVEYEFTLVELWDELQDPQTSFLVGRPYYQTTTRATTLLYGPAEPALLPNKNYAWRVRAMVSDGISQSSIFKNNGYSEIYHFEHNGECLPPQFALTKPKTKNTQTVQWQGGNYVEYNLQYRKKGGASNEWFNTSAFNEQANIFNLEEDTTYEYRVGGQCRANGGFSYGNISEFTTALSNDEAAGYQCGILPDIQITNQEPLTRLGVNEVFTAGDFPVTVKGADGANGVYSGLGYISVPYLADTRIAVVFKNVKINSDYQLTNGIVETEYNPDQLDNLYDISGEVELAIELGNQLVDLTSSITEALNLDIDKVTRENTKLIANSIADHVGEEGLTEETQQNIQNAAGAYEKAGAEIAAAKEALENATTDKEKEEAEKQYEQASENYKEAQQTINEVSKDIEKEKGEIADLLKKAIYELYREGRDNEAVYVSNYEENYSKIVKETVYDDKIILIAEVETNDEITNERTESEIEKFYESEVQLSIYLFSKTISESDNKELIEKLIEKAKENKYDLLKTIQEFTNESENEKIEKLKAQLIEAFKAILLNTEL